MDYIIRDNEPARIISTYDSDADNVIELLEKEYPFIYEVYSNDEYNMENTIFEYFQEIVSDNKVVGFYTYTTAIEFQDHICIEEFYVLPEYRGNNIMADTLIDLIISNKQFILKKPTQNVIKILIKNNLAWYFSKNLVRSVIKFSNTYNDIIINKKLRNIYDNLDDEMTMIDIFTNLYDINVCSNIFNDTMELITLDNFLCISTPRKYDRNKYKLSNKIRKIDKKYLKNITKTVARNVIENEEKEKRILDNIYNNISVDKIIDDNEIDHYHNEYDISIEELKSIRDDVQKALDNNEISYQHIHTRFEYLIKNDPKNDATYEGGCNYCNAIFIKRGVCQVCGYNFFDKNLEKIKNDIKNYVDQTSGVYKSLLEKIEKDNLDYEKTINSQLEIAEINFLHFIDNVPDYTSLPDTDDSYEISEKIIVNSLQDKKFIELIDNPYNDDEEKFLHNLKMNSEIPTHRTYKAHIHRNYRYKITKKGRRYYKQNKCANTYLKHIHNMPYYEFKEYYKNNINNISEYEIIDNFINKQQSKAINEDDMDKYVDTCISKVLLTKDENRMNLVKLVICQLNKFYLKDYDNIREKPLTSEVIILLEEYKDIIEKEDLEEIFNQAYDDIQLASLKCEKEKRLDDINEILETDDLSYINQELEFKYEI